MAATRRGISDSRLVAYAAPAVPLAMMNLPMLAILPAFYATHIGIPLAQVGLIFVIARIWDGITDPIVGQLSDHTRTRWGRRRIWMAVAALPLVLSSWWICRPAPGVGAFYLGTGLLVAYLCWTLVQIPYLSWGAELSDSYVERARVAGFREAGTMLGIISVIALPVFVLDAEDPPLEDILSLFLALFSVLLPATIFIALRHVREEEQRHFDLSSLKQSIRALKLNSPFLRFVIALFLFRTAWSVFDANYFLFFQQYMDVPGGFMLYILIGYCASACFAPAIIKLSSRWSKHRILAVSLIANMAFMLLMMSVIDVTSRVQVSAAFIFMGVGIAGTNMLPTAIIADTVDFGRLKGGGEQSGLYMATYNLALKISMAMGVGIAYPVLQLLGFDATVTNTGDELQALALVTCLLPALLMVPAVLLLWNYPLTPERHALIRRYLMRRKEALPGIAG